MTVRHTKWCLYTPQVAFTFSHAPPHKFTAVPSPPPLSPSRPAGPTSPSGSAGVGGTAHSVWDDPPRPSRRSPVSPVQSARAGTPQSGRGHSPHSPGRLPATRRFLSLSPYLHSPPPSFRFSLFSLLVSVSRVRTAAGMKRFTRLSETDRCGSLPTSSSPPYVARRRRAQGALLYSGKWRCGAAFLTCCLLCM